jgi:DNA replication protein DnaC
MEGIQAILSRVQASSQDLNLNSQTQATLPKQTTKDLYSCELCSDTGWITTETGGYKRCECYEKEQLKRLWETSGINTEQTDLTFTTFKTFNEATKTAKETATKYYKNFENIGNTRKNSISFIGQVGSGKTHLAVAIALNFIKKGIQVKYMPYRDVITKIKMNMRDDEYYHKLLGQYQASKVLLIDDLFKGKVNDTDINIMFELINYRYLNNLPMIISSEFTADRMLDFDEAIGSRILEMCRDYTVELIGQENNYRLRGVL